MVITVVFFCLTIYHVSILDPNMIPSGLGFLVTFSALISLKKSGSFMFTAILVASSGTIVNQYDIFFIVNSQHLVDLVWIITISLYIFYTLGTKVGMAILGFNLIGLSISVFVISKERLLEAMQNRGIGDQIDILVNLVVAGSVIIYLIYKIMESNRIAEENSRISREQLMAQNEIVKAQNEEKTVMLKEIHHRVKNNLQVITSLLRLQSREIKDVATVDHFREAMNRVLAMALIHDKLYQTDDLAKVDIKGYLEDLSKDLIDSYSTEIPVNISIASNVEHLVPKSLVSVALLFNELISNSLKHGFKNIDEGKIRIKIHLIGSDKIEMFYSDNGVWKQPHNPDSFGLELIDTLTSQLIGTFDRNTADGTQYHFKFQIEK